MKKFSLFLVMAAAASLLTACGSFNFNKPAAPAQTQQVALPGQNFQKGVTGEPAPANKTSGTSQTVSGNPATQNRVPRNSYHSPTPVVSSPQNYSPPVSPGPLSSPSYPSSFSYSQLQSYSNYYHYPFVAPPYLNHFRVIYPQNP